MPITSRDSATAKDAYPEDAEEVILPQRIFMFCMGVVLPVLLFDFCFSGIGYGVQLMNIWQRASRVPKGDTETLDAIRAANERASLSNLYKVQHILCNDKCDDDPMLSLQNISYTHNGQCDDGNLNATTDACGAGTDCSDCGVLVIDPEGLDRARTVLALLGVLLLLLYLLDASYWVSEVGRLVQKLAALVVVVGLFAASILVAKDYPPLPMALFILGLPMYFLLIRRTVFAHTSVSAFFFCVSASTGLGCVLSLCIWIAWIVAPPGYAWNAATKRLFNHLMRCTDNLHDPDAPVCLEAFMLWISPLINACVCLGLAVMSGLLARSTAGAATRSVVHVKVAVGVLLLGMFGMYIAASVGGANMGLSNAIVPFCAAGLALVLVATSATLGLQTIKQSVLQIPLMKRVRSWSSSAFFQAFFVLCTFPLLVSFLALSYLNQRVRRLGLPCSKRFEDEEERAQRFTSVAERQLELMRGWATADVLAKVLLWVTLLSCLLVGGNKGTYVLLSLLIKACKALPHWGVAVAAFVPVGLIMFLLPPVPGTPVYLCGGVLLVPLCETAFGAPFDPEGCAAPEPREGCHAGFWLAMLFATALCFCMKLAAIVMQQKGIGERLGQRVAVRAAVGINSPTVKAIRFILTQPGMSVGKVMILCGGPDWPTSVFTGILGLNVWSMLYGSVPVVVIVGTSAMAGAFQYAKTKGGPYESLASVALVVGLLAQALFFMGALYYIEDVVQNQAESIRDILDDEEVRQLDERIAQRAAARRREIAWRRVPLWLRLLLLSGSVVGLLAGWFVTLRGGAAFSEFEITMDPDTVLCLEGTPEQPKGWGEAVATPQNPNATGGLCTSPLVRPPGIAACACFLYVFVCLGVWRWWVAKRTREALERQAGGSSPRPAEAAAPDPDRVITTV